MPKSSKIILIFLKSARGLHKNVHFFPKFLNREYYIIRSDHVCLCFFCITVSPGLTFSTDCDKSKITSNYFQRFYIKAVKVKCKIWKKNKQNALNICCFSPLVYGKIFTKIFTIYRVFLSRNYRLIVIPQKFEVLKTNICLRIEAWRANMLVLRTSNFQGATISR